jgi:hypothetical protein
LGYNQLVCLEGGARRGGAFPLVLSRGNGVEVERLAVSLLFKSSGRGLKHMWNAFLEHVDLVREGLALDNLPKPFGGGIQFFER